MNPLIYVWLELALCAALFGFGGVRLSRYGDIVAGKTGLGGSLIGLLLLWIFVANACCTFPSW